MDEQLSFPLPRSMDTRIHMRLITKPKVIIMHLTTVSVDEPAAPVPMGSFVYALPDRFNPDVPLSTPIYHEEPTIDFTTRLAKILVKKTKMHVYVSNSVSLVSTGLGGTFEEEMEAFKKVLEVANSKLRHLTPDTGDAVNGTVSA
ncbi:proteasome assembly chaperone 4 domain-containing protein [Apiospora arundinis]